MKIAILLLAALGMVAAHSTYTGQKKLYTQYHPHQHQQQQQQYKQYQQRTKYNPLKQFGYYNQYSQQIPYTQQQQQVPFVQQQYQYQQQQQQQQQQKYQTPRLHNVQTADPNFLAKQKFLFEIVYRVEDPLIFEEYIQLANAAVPQDKSNYVQFDYYMQKFVQAYKAGVLVPKGEFFGALVKTHNKQLIGLFNFFYYAKTFEIFQANVAWARVHVNEHMFVYALTLAVIHRPDTQGLVLPTIYEIFPNQFFHSKFVYQAEKFNYDVFSKLLMYEKEYKDILYQDVSKQLDNQYNNENTNYYFYTKDWKTWQWYKLMGLEQSFYPSQQLCGRNQQNQDPKYQEVMRDVQMLFMPVDYTRDINIFNDESVVSYFTEDLDWNAFWYYFNLDYAPFADTKVTPNLNKARRGELYLYVVRQVLARYYLERLSNNLGDIPELNFVGQYENGYDPQLIYHNGVGYSYRKNYYNIEDYESFELRDKLINFFNRVDDALVNGQYKTYDGTVIDLRQPEAVEFIGQVMQGQADIYDKHFFNVWKMFTHMFFADVDAQDFEVFPNVLVNFETMMRDPITYSLYKKVANVYFQFTDYVQPYTQQDLLFPGVTVKDVQVTELVTYFDLVDSDVTNLLNDEVKFVDGQLVWDTTLLARQARLNHKPFQMQFTVESNQPQQAVIRTFLLPKFDVYGRTISIEENRENALELDTFVTTLTSGVNTINRNSQDFVGTVGDRTTYTELYKSVMLALEGKFDYPVVITEPYYGFPDRLLLPHGWAKGMPMQLFVYVFPFTGTQQPQTQFGYGGQSIGNGIGSYQIFDKPLGYPLERTVEEQQFFVPNMYVQDVQIYHVDIFQKLEEKPVVQPGQFDYTYCQV